MCTTKTKNRLEKWKVSSNQCEQGHMERDSRIVRPSSPIRWSWTDPLTSTWYNALWNNAWTSEKPSVSREQIDIHNRMNTPDTSWEPCLPIWKRKKNLSVKEKKKNNSVKELVKEDRVDVRSTCFHHFPSGSQTNCVIDLLAHLRPIHFQEAIGAEADAEYLHRPIRPDERHGQNILIPCTQRKPTD